MNNNFISKTKPKRNFLLSLIISPIVDFIVYITIFGVEYFMGKSLDNWLYNNPTFIKSMIGWIVENPIPFTIIIFCFLYFGLMSYDYKRSMETEKTNQSPFHATNQNHSGSGDNVMGDKNVYYESGKKKDKSFVIDEISRLLTKAVDDVKWLSNSAFHFIKDDDFREKIKLSYESGKSFNEYFKSNEHYFTSSERKLIKDIDDFIWDKVDDMAQAKKYGNQKLWSRSTNEILSNIDNLRNKILDEFQKQLS